MAKLSDAEVLRRAKEHLKSAHPAYTHTGICHCICQVGNNRKQEARLCAWVNSQLGGMGWLPSWLRYIHGIRRPEDLKNHEEYNAKLRATRLAWLDWMIAHCEELDGKDKQ